MLVVAKLNTKIIELITNYTKLINFTIKPNT